MTKQERLMEINKELKALAEEKKRLLAEIEAEKEVPAATNKTLDDMSVEELKAYAKANSMKLTSKVKSKMIQQILDYEKARGSHGRLFRVYEANRYFV